MYFFLKFDFKITDTIQINLDFKILIIIMKPVNRILAFDVSNNSCSVAISTGQRVLAYRRLKVSMQAEILIALIEGALQSINYDYKDIDYLALLMDQEVLRVLGLASYSRKVF